ncbi:MAG TPA: heme ABC exporter ATP-binding protein CcmA [Anaerolineaceae bacterium]|jgi:heme exporter protein A|nr:heme ABC exporter ATP-binding protein CcmA [Anaerolineaceae bacterium]
MIEARQLVRRFGYRTVLRSLDFSALPGEFIVLLGPNGAGKTTLLRIFAALLRPTSGGVTVAGCELPRQAAQLRARLGVVSHQPLLYGDLTAVENLHFYGQLYGVPRRSNRIEAMLALAGLEAVRNDLVRTFSRGMQQRLSIGRAMLSDPQVLLLDEPHTGLDQDACLMLDRTLAQVAGEGRTLLMASHDLARAAALASRVDILVRGRIVASTPTAALPPDGLLAFYRQTLEDIR